MSERNPADTNDHSEDASSDLRRAEQPGVSSNDREDGEIADVENGAPIDISMA